MKFIKKIVALVLVCTLTFSFSGVAALADEVPGNAKKTVYVSAVGDYNGIQVNMPKTPVQIAAAQTLTEACDMALTKNGLEHTMEWGYPSTISGLGTVAVGESWYYWAIYVNGAYASGTDISDGDEISIIYVTDENVNVMETPDFADDAALNPGEEAIALLKDKITKAQTILSEYIFKNILRSGEIKAGIGNADEIAAIYNVFTLRQAGFKNDQYYKAVYDNIVEELKNTSDFSDISKFNVANYSKLIMLVTALGYDALDVGGVNLIEKLTDRQVIAASSSYLREATLLIAMSTGNYSFPEGEAFITEEEIINEVIGQVDSAIENSISWGCDMAAMTIQGLWRHYDSNPQVKAACDKVIRFLERMQAPNGYFNDLFTTNNVWSTAQVMITMGVFNRSAVSEEDGSDFVKNGKTVIDSMAEFFDLEAGTVSYTVKSFDPAQVLRGINATVRSLNGEKNIFDCVGNTKPQIQPEQIPEGPAAPPTGDSGHIWVIVALLALSAVGVVTCRKKSY